MPYRIPSAQLDHLGFFSPNPQQLADFYARTMGMKIQTQGDFHICTGPDRCLIFSPGEASTMSFSAFRFKTRSDLTQFRGHLETQGIEIEKSPSPIFAEDAIALRDPNGMLSVYGHLDATSTGLEIPINVLRGRLQHYAIATPEIDTTTDFYTQKLGFTVSDRVTDEDGALRAIFLRTDTEHHTLAIFLADRVRPDHHCYEAGEWLLIRDWGDHMAECRVPLQWGPGRHGPGHNLFFMIHDPDGNWVEISAELDIVSDNQTAGEWPHKPETLNSWGQAFLRS